MADQFNPTPSCVTGLEWLPVLERSIPIQADNDVVVVRLRSTEDVTPNEFLWLFLDRVLGLDDFNPSGFEVEIYEEGNLGTTELQTQQFLPSSDSRNFGGFRWDDTAPAGDATTDLWQAVDNTVLVPGIWPNSIGIDPQPVDDDSFIFPLFGQACDVAFRFDGINGAAGSGVDVQRITRVSLFARVNEYIWSQHLTNAKFGLYALVNGQRHIADGFSIMPTPGGAVVAGHFYSNPHTRLSWKAGDLGELDTDNPDPTSGLGILVGATGTPNNLPAILQVWCEVETTTDANDPRVAFGGMSNAPDVGFNAPHLGWNRLLLNHPSENALWDRQADTNYVVTIRRSAGAGSIGMRHLASDAQFPGVWDNAFAQLTVPSRLPTNYGLLTDRPVFRGTAYPIMLADNTGALGLDSMPYASGMGDLEPSLGINDQFQHVDSGNVIRQDLTPGVTDEFGYVRFVGRMDRGVADGDLLVKLKRDSDDGQEGGTLTITPADVEPTITNTWQIIEGQLFGPAPTLTNGVQYYLEFTSTATPGRAWQVQVLSTHRVGSTFGPPADVVDTTFHGGTDVAHFNGTPVDTTDVAVGLYTVPNEVAGFNATFDAPSTLNWVTLTWTPGDVAAEGCGDFLQYEIERSLDGLVWERIAEITTEEVDELRDVEMQRNRTVRYRMRVRRADRAVSNWTATEEADTTVNQCGYWFGSNEAPDLLRWADDASPIRTDSFPMKPVEVPFYLRDYAVTFHELEWRGAAFDRPLLLAAEGGVNGTEPADQSGQAVWLDFLEAVTPALGATVSYIAVNSSDGDRWLAAVTLAENAAVREEPGGSYTLTVHIREATNVPSIVDAGP